MAELACSSNIKKLLLSTYDRKKDVACALVNWKRVTREQVSSILDRIPSGDLVAIFKRMTRDLKANSNGFPDLVLFPPRRKHKRNGAGVFNEADKALPYLLLEIKGPGDQVQKNQKRWMKYFTEKGIPNRVFRMNLSQ
jgi:hypothetical protein